MCESSIIKDREGIRGQEATVLQVYINRADWQKLNMISHVPH